METKDKFVLFLFSYAIIVVLYPQGGGDTSAKLALVVEC